MLNVSVISPEAVLYEGTTDSVVAPAFDGDVGILTGHAPMMALLGKGVQYIGYYCAMQYGISVTKSPFKFPSHL